MSSIRYGLTSTAPKPAATIHISQTRPARAGLAGPAGAAALPCSVMRSWSGRGRAHGVGPRAASRVRESAYTGARIRVGRGAHLGFRGTLRIAARRGVVLAAGGFPPTHTYVPGTSHAPPQNFPRAVESAVGDGIGLGTAAGGALGEPRDDNALWFPGSIGR
ncbi:MAG: FAD-binding protein [Streptosporangiales bacterium]|nr:FAD-binding protein [Streptosporangiales bacterium]